MARDYRRLAAIVSADAAGYSRLMGRDESGTLAALKAHRRELIDPKIAEYGGRIVKTTGDGLLLEFPSVVEAVRCAVDVQRGMAERNVDLAADQRIDFRIGINVGDIIIDGDDIFGDGVNVAARLQALAPVGGVAVSLTVRDQVVGKVQCSFEDLGEHTVKNIQLPVRVFSVLAPATVDADMAEQVARRRLAICVLPFANMSGDPEQEYFSDGISEDIITDLSKVSALWVTARNTAFTFKDKHVDVPQVARQLKVSHVLEGSVRKASGRVRITAQLIDGATGGHLWAERYDRDLNDIFALQDEISQAIVAALKLKLLPDEKRAIEQRGTTNPEAYSLYLMGRQYSVTGYIGDAHRSESIIRLCRRATEIDPNYARPWALMAYEQTTFRLYFGGEEDGLAAAERALALDPDLAEGHAARARVLTHNARFDEALREIEIALRLDPEAYEVNFVAARWYFSMRRFAEAIPYYEKATTVMEADYLAASTLVSCYRAIGDQEGALRAARRALVRTENVVARQPDHGTALGAGVLTLALLGQVERAKEWTERAMLLDPDNLHLRYDLACNQVQMGEFEAALDLLGPAFEQKVAVEFLNWAKADPDLDLVRDHPRFKRMLAAAEARLTQS